MIRVLILYPGAPDDLIECRLKHVSLDDDQVTRHFPTHGVMIDFPDSLSELTSERLAFSPIFTTPCDIFGRVKSGFSGLMQYV